MYKYNVHTKWCSFIRLCIRIVRCIQENNNKNFNNITL